ncbi:MAG TPA: hypothetical protein DCR13_02445 [Gammaproteobacteria bacterium]|nr:hypothetical protein [Gammaproteobacteria bacterium]
MSEKRRPILAALDNSSLVHQVIDAALWLAKKQALPVQFLHTIEPSQQHRVAHGGNLTPNVRTQLLEELSNDAHHASKQLIAESKQLLAKAISLADTAGISAVNSLPRHGHLPQALSDLESDFSIAVLGIKGEQHEKTQGLGTQLEAAIRAISAPTLIVDANFDSPSEVLLAYNGSPSAQRALQLLANSHLCQGATIHVMSIAKNQSTAVSQVNEAVAQLGSNHIAIQQVPLVGDPLMTIREYQRCHSIDLTVMGAFSHGKLRGFLLGSFTTQLLLSGQGAYLLVHDR